MNVSCTSSNIDQYMDTQPILDVKEFFTGPIKAWGIIQDWRGHVTSRFDANMVGTWQDNTGTLEEEFQFYDGRNQQRIWTLKLAGDQGLTGTAPDIIGEAAGAYKGSALNMKYQMELEVGGRSYLVKFDDWMWRMNDNLVINRAYIKKFGITVAQLTVVMQKTPHE